MSASQSRRKRERAPRLLSVAAELAVDALAIPGFALGLLVIAVFFQVAVEMTETLWQGVIAFLIAGAAAVGGLALVGWLAATRLAITAAGWVAMVSGQCPEEFRAGRRNGTRGLLGLGLAVVAGALGLMLFRLGVREAELNWAIEGLFLIAGGGVFGLGAAIPRLYFARVQRVDSSRWRPDGVVTFVVAATLGVGLSLGITMGFANTARVAARERSLRPARWAAGCVRLPAADDCVAAASFVFAASTAGPHRIELRGRCARVHLATVDGTPLPVAGWPELRRLNIRPVDAERDLTTSVVTLTAGQPTRLTVTPASGERCTFKLRATRIMEAP